MFGRFGRKPERKVKQMWKRLQTAARNGREDYKRKTDKIRKKKFEKIPTKLQFCLLMVQQICK